MKILSKLFEKGFIDEQKKNELELEAEKTGRREEEIILEKKIVSEQVLFEAKSSVLKIQLRKIKADEVSMDILKIIPEEAAINYKMVSIGRQGDAVEVGMVYPEDILSQNALRFLGQQEKFSYKIFLITFSDYNNLLKQHRNLKSETKEALEEIDREKKDLFGVLQKNLSSATLEEEAPVIKMVLVILRHAVEGNASDIHIEPGKEKLNIRFRQDGILHPSLFLPLSVHPSIVARIKIIAGLKIDETRIPQDGRFTAKISTREIDFRVSTFPTLYGEKVEIRVLDPKEGLKTFEQLGLRGRNFDVIREAIKQPYGLILATGPTGSGKTTTLYALLRILNQESVNIVTIEDPIEYAIPGINQSQIKPEIGYTFASGLRQILRQDPNIIMVGEIRDEETANLTIHSALTGHIVFSTIHTNSTVGVIPRLLDMGVRQFLIPSTLKLAISQRLIRVLCKNCKQKIKPNEKVKNYILDRVKSLPEMIRQELQVPDPFYIYEAKGCEFCSFTGYAGRTGLFEVLAITDELEELIAKDPSERPILKLAQKQGMTTMEQDGIMRVIEGETTFEEVTRVTEKGET